MGLARGAQTRVVHGQEGARKRGAPQAKTNDMEEGLLRGGGKLSVNGWLTRLHRDGATSEHTGRGEKEREVTKRYGCSRLREERRRAADPKPSGT